MIIMDDLEFNSGGFILLYSMGERLLLCVRSYYCQTLFSLVPVDRLSDVPIIDHISQYTSTPATLDQTNDVAEDDLTSLQHCAPCD